MAYNMAAHFTAAGAALSMRGVFHDPEAAFYFYGDPITDWVKVDVDQLFTLDIPQNFTSGLGVRVRSGTDHAVWTNFPIDQPVKVGDSVTLPSIDLWLTP